MTETEQKIKEYKMSLLNDLLSQCTEGQQDKFHKLFSEEQLKDSSYVESAIAIIERTLVKNKESKS